MRLSTRIVIAAAGLTVIFCAGCRSVFEPQSPGSLLRASAQRAIEAELGGLRADETPRHTTQPPSDVEETLAHRRDELDGLSPAMTVDDDALPVGADLTGGEQTFTRLTLADAVLAAVENNLDVRIAQLQPAINAEDVTAAEAAFDALLFSNLDFSNTDQPTTVPTIGGTPLGTAVTMNERLRFDTGVRQPLVGGGQFTISTDLTRSDNKTPGFSFTPDPANTAAMRLELTQPLLRGFGEAVNTANIRLAQNARAGAVQQLHGEMLRVVAQVEAAYWDLHFAVRDLTIQSWLVEQGIAVRDVIDARRVFDALTAQYADAVARVEQRHAELIRARQRVRGASDRLKQLMNEPRLPLTDESLILPADDPTETPIEYSLRAAVMTALSSRPEIEQAVLAIDDASIRALVADNARLPLLNALFQTAATGLDGGAANAYGEVADLNFIDYVLGLQFEYPLGNRAAEAGYRRARLQESAALLGYQRTVEAIIIEVKNALRDVITNYELIQATRSSRIANAENLRAFLVEEEQTGRLTPEFLNLKFTRQDTLAASRQQEVAARVNFVKSLAELYRAMGVGLEMNQIDFERAPASRPAD